MELRDTVYLPAHVMGLVLDLGDVLIDELSGVTSDAQGEILSVDRSIAMQPLPGACEFMRQAVMHFSLQNMAVCTAQSEDDAKLSIFNLFPSKPAVADRLFTNTFFAQNKQEHPRLFRRIATHLNCAVENLLFIDDKIEAIISALQAGYGYAILITTDLECDLVQMSLLARARLKHFPNVSPEVLKERVLLVSSIQAIQFTAQ